MRIWGDVPKVSEVYGKHRNVSKIDKTSGAASKKDVVSISNEAKEFQTGMKAVKEVPDIRTDRVNELKDKYESGNYDISGQDVAEKLLGSIINKKG